MCICSSHRLERSRTIRFPDHSYEDTKLASNAVDIVILDHHYAKKLQYEYAHHRAPLPIKSLGIIDRWRFGRYMRKLRKRNLQLQKLVADGC